MAGKTANSHPKICPASGKQIHGSKAEAMGQRSNLRRRGKHQGRKDARKAGSTEIMAYKCRLCGGWHVGHGTRNKYVRARWARQDVALADDQGAETGHFREQDGL